MLIFFFFVPRSLNITLHDIFCHNYKKINFQKPDFRAGLQNVLNDIYGVSTHLGLFYA